MTKESYLGAREATTITTSRPQSLNQPPWSVSQYHTLKCFLVSPTSLNISQKKCKECSAGREDRGDDRPGTNMPRRSWSRLSMSALMHVHPDGFHCAMRTASATPGGIHVFILQPCDTTLTSIRKKNVKVR